MGVNIKRERPLAMPHPLLAQLQRHSETVHQRNVRVAESMQPTALDTKTIEQSIQLPFHHEILIPRRSQSRGEKPTAFVRLPLRKIFRKMCAKKWRQSETSIPMFAFR